MKDTKFNGKKNNIYYQTILNKNRFNRKFRLSTATLPTAGGGGTNQLGLSQISPALFALDPKVEVRKYYHISNIRAVNRIGPHNEDVLSVIIGSLLGDAYANKRSGEGVRICYRQSIRHKEYLFWLYNFFYNRGYASNLQPRQYTRTIKNKVAAQGKIYYGYEFNTFTFRNFNWIHGMFYNNGRKIIPQNLYEFLTPLALAVWIMDDGGWTNSGVRIATNSFKLKDIELLQAVLKSKYKLETTIQKLYIKDQYSLYIKKQSVNNLRNIVGSYIHFSMLYKLG
jgi:ubiquinol-cytochrome c reductase cytochrome b subunit